MKSGSSEFFITITGHGIEDARPVDSEQKLASSVSAVKQLPYSFHFPDAGAEKLIRRGILSCSAVTTPSCQFTMLLPSTTTR